MRQPWEGASRIEYPSRMRAVSPSGVLLVVMAVASAAIHLYADYRGPRWLVYVMKPLTKALLIGLAGPGEQPIRGITGRFW